MMAQCKAKISIQIRSSPARRQPFSHNPVVYFCHTDRFKLHLGEKLLELAGVDKKGNSEFTTLQEIIADPDGALVVPDSTHYEIIDYADLGDRERDPFVQRVQSHLVGGDWHTH
jgi:hypothetical protein